MTEIYLAREGDSREVEMNVGDLLILSLPENPTTGFRWAFDALDRGMFFLQKDEYKSASGSGLGGGGIRIFSISAQTPGQSQIRLKLWRDWEGQGSVRDRFEFLTQVAVVPKQTESD
jgi:inhibitor of cysteine peptidase